MEKCLRISAEVKLQRACAENDELRDHIKFLEYRLSRNNENSTNNISNNNHNKDKSEDEAFNGRNEGPSLVRSRSLSSLDSTVVNGSQDNNYNIQQEVNAACLRDNNNSDDINNNNNNTNNRNTNTSNSSSSSNSNNKNNGNSTSNSINANKTSATAATTAATTTTTQTTP